MEKIQVQLTGPILRLLFERFSSSESSPVSEALPVECWTHGTRSLDLQEQGTNIISYILETRNHLLYIYMSLVSMLIFTASTNQYTQLVEHTKCIIIIDTSRYYKHITYIIYMLLYRYLPSERVGLHSPLPSGHPLSGV